MILQKLQLNNIRSYEKETIHFKEGITLFEGDIGSGKSSILNAIEFAFFGLGDQNGTHLLRLGESEGNVELEIKVNNQTFTFKRSLKRRGARVGQSDCYIIEDGILTKYNITDMKKRVLQILDFKEPPNPRSQSVIYRYAVFTPQEQMKEAIRQKIEDRKETLRKAFGVEEYSIAAENTGNLLTEIKYQTRTLDASLEEVPKIKERIEEENKNNQNEEIKICEAEKALNDFAKKLAEIETKIEKTRKQKELLEAHQTNKKLGQQEKGQREEQVANLNQTISELQTSLEEAKKSEQIRNQLEPKYFELQGLREQFPHLEEKYSRSKNAENQIVIIQKEIQGLKTHLEYQNKTIKESLEKTDSEKRKAEQAKIIQKDLQIQYNELLDLKKQLPVLEKVDKQNQHALTQIKILEEGYKAEKEILTRKISDEKEALQELEKQIQETQHQLQKLPDLIKEVESLKKQIEKKSDYQTLDQELRKTQTTIGQQIVNLSTQKSEKELEWRDIKNLGVGAPCPRCHQQLTEKHYNQIEKEYQKEIQTITNQIETNQIQLDITNTNLLENSEVLSQLETIEEQSSSISEEVLTLNTIKKTHSGDEQRAKTKQKTIQLLEKDLEEENYAIKIKEDIQIHQETLTNLETAVMQYTEVKTTINTHEKNNIESRYVTAKTQADQLPELENQIKTFKEQIEKLESNLQNETYAINKKAEIQAHEQNIEELRKDVESYHSTKKTIEDLEKEQVEAKYTKAQTESKRIPEIETSKKNISEKVESHRSEIKKIDEKLRELKGKIRSMEKIPEELEIILSEKESLTADRATQTQIIKGSQEAIQGINDRLVTLNEDLDRHKENLDHAEILKVTEAWISQVLLPSIQSIEKNVLFTINQEFNKLFKRWFSSLIESDELQGYIDENFTPIIEQGGYELEVESLSGGEKTSVALAYRLALNTIVKQVTNTMKNNLLILDEPTDGFSKYQLTKLRDILNELGCDQVILVSHEKELEDVADSIYRVSKYGNTSTVTHP